MELWVVDEHRLWKCTAVQSRGYLVDRSNVHHVNIHAGPAANPNGFFWICIRSQPATRIRLGGEEWLGRLVQAVIGTQCDKAGVHGPDTLWRPVPTLPRKWNFPREVTLSSRAATDDTDAHWNTDDTDAHWKEMLTISAGLLLELEVDDAFFITGGTHFWV